MQRNYKETQVKYCKNCHIPILQSIKQIHQSYCHISTPKCTKCNNPGIRCNQCQNNIPSCQTESHKTECDQHNNRSLRKNLGFQTICPYCKRVTNVNDILKHIDKCVMKRDQRVLSDNVDSLKKTHKVSNREEETSIEKIKHHKGNLFYRIYQNGGKTKRNQIQQQVISKQKPVTEQVIPLNNQDNQIKQKISFQRRLVTPVPLFMKMGSYQNHMLSKIKPISNNRTNIGKLTKNY